MKKTATNQQKNSKQKAAAILRHIVMRVRWFLKGWQSCVTLEGVDPSSYKVGPDGPGCKWSYKSYRVK